MRVDKFLWCVRVFKTRNIASEACKKNRILINDEVVKASKDVIEGDVILIKKNAIQYTLKVLQIPKSRISAKLKTLYVNDITPIEQVEKWKEIMKVQRYYRNKGEGRPTKKDRREITDFVSHLNWEGEEE